MKHKLIGKVYSGDEIIWRSSKILPDLKVGFCETCSFYHAYPYPNEDFLSNYYDGYKIPCPLHQEELDRVSKMIGSRFSTSADIVDIGCGKGELLATLKKHGFKNLYGTEFGHMAEEAKKMEAITIFPYDIYGFCEWCKKESRIFDCVILINVLEHVPNPKNLLKQLKNILSPEGLLVFCVPNDFSVLQKIYLDKTQSKPWFLILPDHINYFSLETIDGVLEKTGYKLINKTVQYPLEFFLLQGDDYVANPELGKSCHNKRVKFEKTFNEVGQDQRLEHIYEGFANIGVGRDMYIFAKSIL